LIGAETFWIKHMIAGEVVARDREAEFHSSGNLLELVGRWEDLTTTCDSILGKLSSAKLGESRNVDNRPEWGSITVRWCILHQISHYALHLGHIQLTRQLWEQK
jgi:hypothetical protein